MKYTLIITIKCPFYQNVLGSLTADIPFTNIVLYFGDGYGAHINAPSFIADS